MDQLLSYVLTLILIYGYPIIFGAILLAYLGVPIPLNVLILAAGAFTTDKTISMYLLIPMVFVSAVIGDITQYLVGKYFGYLLVNKYTAKIGLTQLKLDAIKIILDRWGGGFIFTTRWLLTPLGTPTNLIAGINNYSFKSFLLLASLGELIWATLFIYLGHLFGANWVTLKVYINNMPTFFATITLGCLFVYLDLTLWQKRKRHHKLGMLSK